jgi:hypothetical protein
VKSGARRDQLVVGPVVAGVEPDRPFIQLDRPAQLQPGVTLQQVAVTGQVARVRLAGERLLVQRPRREEVALLAECLVAFQQLFLRHRSNPPFTLEQFLHTAVGSSLRPTANERTSAQVAALAPEGHDSAFCAR